MNTATKKHSLRTGLYGFALAGILLIAGATSMSAQTLSGTYPVGTSSPTYQKLTQVAAALNSSTLTGNVVFELQADYDGTTGETFPITFNQILRSGPYSVIIRPATGATNLVTSGDPGTSINLITINGADSLSFDGRAGGVGTTINWTLRNTRTLATVGTVVAFQNDATKDTLRYINAQSQNTAVGNATIFFGTTIGTLGNSMNVIANCDIRDRSDVAGVPHSAINSAGSAGAPNNDNIIKGNTIRNFTTNGIRITSNSNNWTIGGATSADGNNIYQEAARSTAFTSIGVSSGNTFTIRNNKIYQTVGINTSSMTGIAVIGSGNGHTIADNSIGGSNSSRTGSSMLSNAGLTSYGIQVTVGTTTVTNVYNNRISNWGVLSTATTSIANGIYISGGNVNVGTLGGNILGGAVITGVPSDTLVTSYDNGWINIAGGTTVVVENNTVTNASYYRNANDRNCAIYCAASTAPVIRNNIISTLKGNNTSTNGSTFITMGIYCSVTNATIEGNTITDLLNFNSAAVGPATKGIFWSGAAGTIRNNKIYNIRSNGTQTGANAPWVHGIYSSTGNPSIYNNYISVGANSGNDVRVNGITINNTSNPGGTVSYNTIYVNGTATGTNNSYAFLRLSSSNTALRNNLLYNERSGGTGAHYAIGNTNATPATNWTSANSDYNYFVTANAAQVGLWGTTVSSLLQWRTNSAGDNNTNSIINSGLPSATVFVSAATGNLKISPAYYTTASDLESKGIVVATTTVDIENDARPGPVGSVNGGGAAPDIGADEFDGTPVGTDIGVTVLVLPSTTGCHTNCEVVRVRIHNYSAVPLNMATSNVTVTASVAGPNPVSFPVLVITSGTLAGIGNLDTAVSICYNMTTAGTYVFSASATAPGDGNALNNAMSNVSITISGGTYTAGNGGEICLGSSTTLNVVGYTSGGTVQWQSSPDNISWSNIPGATTSPYTHTPSDTTFYRAVICGLHISSVDTVFPELVLPATTVNDTICGAGTAVLTANGSGTLNWYTASTGGTQVNTGAIYSVPLTTTDTFYVENTSGTTGGVHTTTFAAGNGSSGNCFTIKALNTLTITSFDGHLSTTAGTPSTWEIWYRPNDYLLSPGSHLSSAGWTQLGTGSVNSAGPGNPTPIPVTLSLTIPAGQTYSFQIFTTTGSVSYTNGTTLGALYNSNADLEVYQGHGGTSFAGMVNSPRVFNGRIHYATGCGSTRTPVIGVVSTAPSVTVSASSSTVCEGDSSLLSATSTNNGYAYSWSPAVALNTTSGDSVYFNPVTPGTYTYYMTANDAVSGCTFLDTVSLSMVARPAFTLTTSDDSVCANTQTQLNTVLPPPIIQVTNGNTLNTSTTYPAPYGQFYGGSRHQMLILASELTAAGMTAGYYNGMTFQVTNTNASAPLMNFTIQMGMTNVTDLSAGFVASSMTTVYTNASYAPNVGINTHNFSTAFYWDGISNIVVETCFANYTSAPNTTFTTNCTMRQVITPFVSCAYNRYDNTANICGIASLFTASQRPNMAFLRSSAGLGYGWTPLATVASPTSDTTLAFPPMTQYYTMTVVDSATGCATMDSILINVLPTPSPDLGPDSAICSNTSLVLDGGAGNNTYLWQDNSTSQTLTVSSLGSYSVLVTDTTSGCFAADTVNIGVNAAPSFTLGADATVCAGTQVSFSGPAGSFNYDWSTSDSTMSISTGTQGSYELEVTDQVNGCSSMDTVMLTVNPVPIVALGADTSLCSASGSLTLAAPAGTYSYQWSTLDSAMSIAVNATGSYYVVVTDTNTSCMSGDTINVTYNTSPTVNVGPDTTTCGSYVVDAGNPGSTYLWCDGSTTQTATLTSSGQCVVMVTDVNGCSTNDTISVVINANPVVNLGPDVSTCTMATLNDPNLSGGTFLWCDNSSGSSVIITTSGSCELMYTDVNGCTDSDTINVTIFGNPTVTASGSDLSPCAADANVILTGSPSGGTFTGTSVTGTQFDPSVGAGSYNIVYNYTDVNGCSGADTITVVVGACVGIEEQFVGAGMTIYPNPNAGFFTFTAADLNCKEMTIEIVTVEGQVIQSNKYNNVQGDFVQDVDMSGFANGVYIMRVTTDGSVYTNRVVKQD